MARANSSPPSPVRRGSQLSLSQRLDHLVQSHPQQAIVEAQRVLQSSPSDGALVRDAWATIGRALYELGDMHRAPDAMRQALRADDQLEQEERLTSVRISAAAIFAESGKLADALHQLQQAEIDADPAILGRVQLQRAFILCHAGRLVEALEQAELSDSNLRKSGDRLGQLRLMVNRSLINLQRGELVLAEADLQRARRLADRLEQSVIAAGVTANLGVVHARAGRILRALQHFELANELYADAGNPLRMMAIMETDRAETLLLAGMFGEAVSSAHLAVAHARASGNMVNRCDAELLLARAQLAAGDARGAQRTASAAARVLLDGRRRGMVLQARAIGMQASLETVQDAVEALRLFPKAGWMAERLERFGWPHFADELRCARLRCAARFGYIQEVEDDLATLRRSIRSRRPGIALRAWYAECLSRAHAGDVAGAMRSARAGMRALDRLRRSTVDLEMRAGLSAIGADLSSVALEIAIAIEKPSGAFTWAERTRANAVLVESQDRDISVPQLATITRQLAGRLMVEFVINAGHVWAVVIGRGRPRLVKLGKLDEMRQLTEQLMTWLERAAQPSEAGRVDHAQRIAEQLDAMLVAPLGLRPSDRVVVVPVGALHAVPWSCLPSLRWTSLAVTPSARLWLECERRAVDFGCRSVALLVGPDVVGGKLERSAIARSYPGATMITGKRANVSNARVLLAQYEVVQIAAHGTFRADQPLMSSLRLFGDEMSLYELATTDVSARLVVLSSCEGGVHGVSSGSEVLGLASILLSRGAATVVAPVAIVSDHACAEFVAELHREWDTGLSIAAAMAAVRRRWLAQNNLAKWATASAFMCFGTGSLTKPGRNEAVA